MSLHELLEEDKLARLRPNGVAYGVNLNGFGFAVLPEKVFSAGEQGTSVSVISDSSLVYIDAVNTQIHGQLSLFPDEQHKVFSINGGQLNAKLFPDKTDEGKTKEYVYAKKKDDKEPLVKIPRHTHTIVTPVGPGEVIDTIYEPDSDSDTDELSSPVIYVKNIFSTKLFGDSIYTNPMLKREVDTWTQEMNKALSELNNV